MEFDMTKVVEEMAIQAKETQEEFIFETIRPYCENILQLKINKEELKQILLNGTQKQQPCDKCVYSTKDGYCQYDDITEAIPPLDPCEDAVSRDMVINKIEEWADGFEGWQYISGKLVADAIRACEGIITELPSVTPTRLKGEWIQKEGIYGASFCDRCNFELTINDTNFCPNCGADMRINEE